jgi:hypothetical protein
MTELYVNQCPKWESILKDSDNDILELRLLLGTAYLGFVHVLVF